jgi:hypothetical protein
LHANKWFCFQDQDLRLRGMWRPTKEEIGKWLEERSVSFQEIKIRTHGSVQRLQRYVFTYLHEIFFVDFLNVLAEWL